MPPIRNAARPTPAIVILDRRLTVPAEERTSEAYTDITDRSIFVIGRIGHRVGEIESFRDHLKPYRRENKCENSLDDQLHGASLHVVDS